MSNPEPNPATCQDATCKEEALYHCTICKGKFCFQHVCVHLKQAQTLPLPTCDEIESEESGLRSLSDMEIRSRRNRLFEELKRVQRELDRRMIFAADYFVDERKIRPALNYGHPFYADPKEDKKAAATIKSAAKQAAEIEKLKELMKQVLGNGKVSPEELKRRIKK